VALGLEDLDAAAVRLALGLDDQVTEPLELGELDTDGLELEVGPGDALALGEGLAYPVEEVVTEALADGLAVVVAVAVAVLVAVAVAIAEAVADAVAVAVSVGAAADPKAQQKVSLVV
jgi:hypothetical protein